MYGKIPVPIMPSNAPTTAEEINKIKLIIIKRKESAVTIIKRPILNILHQSKVSLIQEYGMTSPFIGVPNANAGRNILLLNT